MSRKFSREKEQNVTTDKYLSKTTTANVFTVITMVIYKSYNVLMSAIR